LDKWNAPDKEAIPPPTKSTSTSITSRSLIM
jgi:hypothetical protein